jgi:hypothetical protein
MSLISASTVGFETAGWMGFEEDDGTLVSLGIEAKRSSSI